MKKIIFLGLLISLSVYAEENPFSLAENFQKIDRAQDELLASLENINEDKIDRKTSKHVDVPLLKSMQDIPIIVKQPSPIKAMQTTKDIYDTTSQQENKNIEKAKEAHKIEEEKKAKIARAKRIREERVEAMKIKQLAKARREATRKEEQKKMAMEIAAKEKELQAFEKKRIEKLAEEERKKVEQKRKKDALSKQQKKVMQKHKVNAIDAINLEEEASEKEIIEQAYLDAIKEVK